MLRTAAIAIAAAIVLACILGWQVMRGSLPLLDGEVAFEGFRKPVEVLRDDLGVVTIRAAGSRDLVQATGFVHAQDRFFQMDLLRRKGAGELSALFGPIALEVDRDTRLHRFRHRARVAIGSLDDQDRALLDAYARGVNQGLASMRLKPFEYFLLGATPEPWVVEDSFLAIFAMYLVLNDSRADRDRTLGLLHDALPQEMVRFLVPPGTRWDAPMQGGAYRVPDAPGAEIFDLRETGPVEVAGLESRGNHVDAALGSNNWAVGGDVTSDGSAIVANDMHLPLAIPNTFYRARLELTGDAAGSVTGVTLPGVPSLIAGSNGRIAWGFTNSYGDWSDLVVLRIDPEDPERYLTPEGYRRFDHVAERIAVKGADDVVIDIVETVWGPVMEPDHRDRISALRWLAHAPEAVGIITGMETAGDIFEGMSVANRSGLPPQNIVIADADGRIAWTIMGRIPRRAGFDPSQPADWSGTGEGWAGWVLPEDYPRVVDPESGRIWTANARVVDKPGLRVLGDGGYALGARSGQIRDRLFDVTDADVADMLAIQLDDRAVFFDRWRELALVTLTDDELADTPSRRQFHDLVSNWTPRASAESVGFRLVYEFRLRLLAEIFEALTAPVRELDPGFHFAESQRYGVGRQFEGVAWRLLTDRPAHLLNPLYQSWDAQVLGAIDATIAEFDDDLARHPWGERNRSNIRHPLSGAIPVIGTLLNMRKEALHGATHMPRVQTPDFGASERFAVSPGREQEGYFHMPAGQSGHPLSPFYRAGHDAWVQGEPTPFLPGPPHHRLLLTPGP